MTKYIVAIVFTLSVTTGAFAAFNKCGAGFCINKSGGSGPPPSCSNSLVFSDACNSQYIPAVFQ